MINSYQMAFDGEVLVFAARVVPEPVDNNLEFTTWNLWTYNFVTGELDYLIVDLPAALSPDQLFDQTYDANSILIPVVPSEIDQNRKHGSSLPCPGPAGPFFRLRGLGPHDRDQKQADQRQV